MPQTPPIVTGVIEARKNLLPTLKRFREEGRQAAPAILGAHRKPEAVILPYERYIELLTAVERQRYDMLGLDPHHQAGTTAQITDNSTSSSKALQEFISNRFELPSYLADAVIEAVDDDNGEGMLSYPEAQVLVAAEVATRDAKTIEEVLTEGGLNPAMADIIRAHAERAEALTLKEARHLLRTYPTTLDGHEADGIKLLAGQAGSGRIIVQRVLMSKIIHDTTVEFEHRLHERLKLHAMGNSDTDELADAMNAWQAEHGTFTPEERAAAVKLFDDAAHVVVEPSRAEVKAAEEELDGMGHS